ncbi:MAG: aldehyde dehydrogenase family protein, partial [Myxococcales bacterium]
AAGNTVVLKPSVLTSLTALELGKILMTAGLPAGAVNIITGTGREAGAALAGHPGIDKVSFTGSVATGRRVGAACAERLIPFTLELGGKDAMIVCEDADMDRTVAGALFGSCMNSGHFCCGTERIYVPEKIYDEFVERVVDATKKLRQSDNGGEADVGPVFWDKQLDIIEAHMADARAKGAKVLVGGRRNPDLKGLFYEPTVVVDVDHDMDLMTKETFGPIISIMKVKDEEEAITLANDSEYGLNGNVWTTDEEKGMRIAERIETGGVCVNDMAITYGVPEAPFGGVKHSGLGQVNGEVGIKGYAHCKPITSDRKKGKGKVQGGFPYTEKSEKDLWRAIRYMMGTKIGRWFL